MPTCLKHPLSARSPQTPQPARAEARQHVSPARGGPPSRSAARPGALLRGNARTANRHDGRVVIELELG
jgi:hypothetical protein